MLSVNSFSLQPIWKRYLKCVTGLSILITFLIPGSQYFLYSRNTQNARDNRVVILMWNEYYGDAEAAINLVKCMQSRWNSSCCHEHDEFITSNRAYFDSAHAVVFYNLFFEFKPEDMPTRRDPDQIWVLFAKEPPHQKDHENLNNYGGLFNLTMTYRHDSDIWAPYGLTGILKNPLENTEKIYIHGVPLTKWVANKSKLMLGVASHCPTISLRENLVERLRQDGNISLDIFGKCGKPICNRMDLSCDHSKLWLDFAKTYKFYFAAENDICVDYITEKFWRSLALGMVPVVYGGGNYSLEAPPNSYIDARDFNSPAELARYLTKLDEDIEEYKKYFEWRRRYTVFVLDGWSGWCTLCDKLKEIRNRGEETKSQKIYTDLRGWWFSAPIKDGDVPRSVCSKPLNILNYMLEI